MSGMVTSLKERIDSQNSDIIEFLNETANIKGRLQRYETMQEQTQIRQSELDQKLIALQSEESSQGELVEAFKKEAQGVAIELERIQAEQAACKKRATKISDDLMKCRDAFNAAEKSFHEESARYQTLKNITDPSRTDTSDTVEKDRLKVTSLGNGKFQIKAEAAYQEGATYQLTIEKTDMLPELTFENEPEEVIYYNFTIKKEETLSVCLIWVSSFLMLIFQIIIKHWPYLPNTHLFL